MERPRCKRYGGPLDFFYDPDSGYEEWICNNPNPLRTDEEHWKEWEQLDGDQVAHLEATVRE